MSMIRLAVPTGRLSGECLRLAREIGLPVPSEEDLSSRQLRFAGRTVAGPFETVLVKDGDVPVYVEHGVADFGFAGSDQVLEQERDVLMPVELSFGRCRLMLIGKDESGWSPRAERVRVATKYPRLARRLLARRALRLEIVPLQGSVELAAVLGLTDFIVDIVESGATIRNNGLWPLETLLEIHPGFIVNRNSYLTRPDIIRPVIERIRQATCGMRAPSMEGATA
jgi:ATP phosphoribosyltransferase